MEINLNNGSIANLGLGRGLPDVQGAGAGHEAQTARKPGAAGFTITSSAAAPEDVEAAAIPESALSRDDDLGRLVSAAFNLPPPPMPDFT